MLKEILRKLLNSSLSRNKHKHYGHKHSSDSYYKGQHGYPPKHNQYGHGYYKKKGYSGSSS